MSSHTLVLSYSHALVSSYSRTLMLPWPCDLVRLSSDALKLPCCHALMLLCSCAIVLSCSLALVRLQTRSYISIDGSLRSTYIPLSIADERAKRASKAVSCCHLIVVACSWAAVLTQCHGLMNSCSRAPALMRSCYRSPTLSYRGGVGSCFSFSSWFRLSSRLLCHSPRSLFHPTRKHTLPR